MFPKSSSDYNTKFYFGLILVVPGLCLNLLQIFLPRHSRHIGFDLILLCAGYAVWQSGTYLFVPFVLFSTAAIIDFILHSQISHTVSLAIMALAVVIGFWGWWRERKTQIAHKKMN